MKAFLPALTLLGSALALPAAAQPVTVASLPIEAEVLSTGFGVNPEFGRAWLEVNYSTDNIVPDLPPRMMKVSVPGLRYDVEARAVLLEANGTTTVCARARDRGVGPFRNTYMHPTGACTVSVVSQWMSVDNGFVAAEKPKRLVRLATREAPATRTAANPGGDPAL